MAIIFHWGHKPCVFTFEHWTKFKFLSIVFSYRAGYIWKQPLKGQMHSSRGVLIKGVLKICSTFTGEYPRGSGILIKLESNFGEITLPHGRSSVNLLHIFTTLFKNTSGRMLLKGFPWTMCSLKLGKPDTLNKGTNKLQW